MRSQIIFSAPLLMVVLGGGGVENFSGSILRNQQVRHWQTGVTGIFQDLPGVQTPLKLSIHQPYMPSPVSSLSLFDTLGFLQFIKLVCYSFTICLCGFICNP